MDRLPSIVKIQALARRFLVRLRIWNESVMFLDKIWGAMTIQRLYRGHLARMQFRRLWRLRALYEWAAVVLQTYARGHLARARVAKMLQVQDRRSEILAERELAAAITIQAAVRF